MKGSPQPSRCDTITLPPIEIDSPQDDRNPGLIAKAADQPLRVVVRNISDDGMNVLISYDNPTLQTGEVTPQRSFTLPPGTSEVFPLMPGETLVGSSPNGSGAPVSIIVTVAFPFEAF